MAKRASTPGRSTSIAERCGCDDGSVLVVPDEQHLQVTDLARRARADTTGHLVAVTFERPHVEQVGERRALGLLAHRDVELDPDRIVVRVDEAPGDGCGRVGVDHAEDVGDRLDDVTVGRDQPDRHLDTTARRGTRLCSHGNAPVEHAVTTVDEPDLVDRDQILGSDRRDRMRPSCRRRSSTGGDSADVDCRDRCRGAGPSTPRSPANADTTTATNGISQRRRFRRRSAAVRGLATRLLDPRVGTREHGHRPAGRWREIVHGVDRCEPVRSRPTTTPSAPRHPLRRTGSRWSVS